MTPSASVIILNWNALNDTIECLASSRGINYSNYEVIVVDNGSSASDVQALTTYGCYEDGGKCDLVCDQACHFPPWLSTLT